MEFGGGEGHIIEDDAFVEGGEEGCGVFLAEGITGAAASFVVCLEGIKAASEAMEFDGGFGGAEGIGLVEVGECAVEGGAFLEHGGEDGGREDEEGEEGEEGDPEAVVVESECFVFMEKLVSVERHEKERGEHEKAEAKGEDGDQREGKKGKKDQEEVDCVRVGDDAKGEEADAW